MCANEKRISLFFPLSSADSEFNCTYFFIVLTWTQENHCNLIWLDLQTSWETNFNVFGKWYSEICQCGPFIFIDSIALQSAYIPRTFECQMLPQSNESKSNEWKREEDSRKMFIWWSIIWFSYGNEWRNDYDAIHIMSRSRIVCSKWMYTLMSATDEIRKTKFRMILARIHWRPLDVNLRYSIDISAKR